MELGKHPGHGGEQHVMSFPDGAVAESLSQMALGIEACRNNYRTRFTACYGLVNELIESRQERLLQRLIQKYAHYDLLILDELPGHPKMKALLRVVKIRLSQVVNFRLSLP